MCLRLSLRTRRPAHRPQDPSSRKEHSDEVRLQSLVHPFQRYRLTQRGILRDETHVPHGRQSSSRRQLRSLPCLSVPPLSSPLSGRHAPASTLSRDENWKKVLYSSSR